LVFDSEFRGSRLNSSQWSKGFFGTGVTRGDNSDEEECYNPAQVVVAGDMLSLTAIAKTEACGGNIEPYASGMIMSYAKFSFIYGYMEARIWLPGAPYGIADWPAFWAVGPHWPSGGEIDVLEGVRGHACVHFITHHSPNPGACSQGTFARGWHTFAADWESTSITFYYDGKELFRDTSRITSAPMYLILNLAVAPLIASPVIVPAIMRVDYVRVWQHSERFAEGPRYPFGLRAR
jgi:beta-glucanase (GH16 family)